MMGDFVRRFAEAISGQTGATVRVVNDCPTS